MLYYNSTETKRYTVNMMKRKMVDFSNLAAANYYSLGMSKPAGYDSTFDVAVDNGNLDSGGNNWYIDWTVSDRDLAEAKLTILERLAAYRYSNEENGITYLTNGISTDRESMGMINTAYTKVCEDGAATIDFRTNDGWVNYTAAQMKTLAADATSFIQTCFTAEKDVDVLVNAAVDITALRAIDINNEFDTRI